MKETEKAKEETAVNSFLRKFLVVKRIILNHTVRDTQNYSNKVNINSDHIRIPGNAATGWSHLLGW